MPPDTGQIDQLDGQLIKALREDPRVGLLEIARRVGVARGTVQARLAKLEARGVITGYGPEVEPAAMGYPIAAFVLMISAFGLPHVLYELRYVDERFSARTSRVALAIIGVLLGAIAIARIGHGAHMIPSHVFLPLELGLGAALAFAGAYFMRANRLLGVVIGAAFALGATFAPIETFLIWAWIHNLTPLAFVAEITEGEERRRWLLLLAVPFLPETRGKPLPEGDTLALAEEGERVPRPA